MERETAEKAVKSALAEIAEKFDFDKNLMEYTEANLQRLNDECARLVRRYVEAGEIAIGPFENCISIYNAPMDILSFIPLCGGLGVKEYGTYTVMRGLKTLGRVTYSGRPVQDKPGTAFLGIKTSYIPEEYVPHITLELVIGDESSPLPENFWKELTGDGV